MMIGLLFALGFLPFAFGGLMNWFMMAHPDTLPPFALIAILFLLIWGTIAFVAKRYTNSTKKVIISLNVIAFIVLVLLGIQELILHAYWFNIIGAWSQFFYLPLLNISFTLTSWSHSVFSAYCVAFVLMVVVSAFGCRIRKK